MPSYIRINLPNLVLLIFFLLPLIGSQKILYLTLLAKFLNILAYVVVCWVLAKASYKYLILIGIALVVKIFYLFFGHVIFQTIFWVFTTILIGSFSALYFVSAPNNFRNFVNVYLLVSLPIVILQALGIFEVLHSWNTLFLVCDEDLNCEHSGLVVNSIGKYFADIEMNPAQFRPPGLFHSQALLGALIAFSLVLNVYSTKITLSISLIACIILVVFGMSKITQVQLLIVAGLIIFQYGIAGLSRSLKILFIWISMLLLYNTLVPGLVVFQLSLDQYIFSAGTRLLDFYSFMMDADINTILENKQVVREITNVGVSIASESDRGGLSGLYQLVLFMPFLLILLLRIKYIYKIKNKGSDSLQKILPWEMYIALLLIAVTQIMVTDTFGTQFVMFFWGLLAVPILYSKTVLLNKFRSAFTVKLVW